MNETAIRAFWDWWQDAAGKFDEGFRNTGLSSELVEAMNERVRAIEPDLEWEFGPGRRAKHHLCLSSKGDPARRYICEHWFQHAPQADETWEYCAARQPHPGELELEIGGHGISLRDVLVGFEVDEARELIDVRVYHPVFADIAEENLRVTIVLIALHTLLGEDGVERWVGGIEVVQREPENAAALLELAAAVENLAADATGDKWAALQGAIDSRPIFVSVNLAIKPVDYMLFDQHVEIAIPIVNPTEEGLPTKKELDRLDAVEDRLLELLGGHSVYIGRETHNATRTLHFHVMEGGPAASLIEAWRTTEVPESQISVQRDVGWEVLRRWT